LFWAGKLEVAVGATAGFDFDHDDDQLVVVDGVNDAPIANTDAPQVDKAGELELAGGARGRS
jgi:hypothetical protein